MAQEDVREYAVRAHSTETFGRVLCSARNHHFVADGPAQNGCPGEALLPPELFLAGIASCGVELLQVLAEARQAPLDSVHLSVSGILDRANPVRPGLSVFNSVRLEFQLGGVSREQGEQLVEAFTRR